MRPLIYTIMVILCLPLMLRAAEDANGIDSEVLIRRILAVDSVQRSLVRDVTFDAEYVERENKGDDGFKEKVRLVKRVYLRYDEDTTRFHEEFLEYYKDGKRKNEKDLNTEAEKRREEKRKRKGRDISYSMLTPFYPDKSESYTITYIGLENKLDGCGPCHRFRIQANEEVDSLINGDFYFESATFHLVRVDFSPARLIKKTMFKLKELKLTIIYGRIDDDIWLPERFEVAGKGKAALFFGVNFAGTEYYRNPVINSGLADSLFVGETDD